MAHIKASCVLWFLGLQYHCVSTISTTLQGRAWEGPNTRQMLADGQQTPTLPRKVQHSSFFGACAWVRHGGPVRPLPSNSSRSPSIWSQAGLQCICHLLDYFWVTFSSLNVKHVKKDQAPDAHNLERVWPGAGGAEQAAHAGGGQQRVQRHAQLPGLAHVPALGGNLP